MGSLFDSDTARLLHARLRRLQSATSTAPGRWVGRVASHRLARGKSRGRAWKWQRLEPWPLKRANRQVSYIALGADVGAVKLTQIGCNGCTTIRRVVQRDIAAFSLAALYQTVLLSVKITRPSVACKAWAPSVLPGSFTPSLVRRAWWAILGKPILPQQCLEYLVAIGDPACGHYRGWKPLER
ncbi:hypothetical protein BO79DRAFT_78692 [Aspergillus costaricaensis CBS 115574]|uniref:Uncharacterized protein n=1 Tax=Aspergillus costaricaensis CBS 115574 TaxID=1448317 RepID=A0ACD1IL15_9EURO|nr:hypothetical protein BO79DRAFT_78692 [Aspergillus costaricaensis CBS 115574]RAK91042.1 hypothetical protein BO79DRAFT_78692 [Aspergillus costaricaensis CBS 115574]